MPDLIDYGPGQIKILYLRDGSSTKQMGAFELTVPPNCVVPPHHSHTDNEECVYVLEGTLRYSVDADTRDLKPGDTMFTPKGSVHGFSNPYAESTRALVILSPDVGAGYFKEMKNILSANPGGPPDKKRVLDLMTSYGLKLPKV